MKPKTTSPPSPQHGDGEKATALPLGRIVKGDALEVLRGWPAGSVQCVVTSPPYWGLRDYGEPGQGGLEETPEEHVAWLVGVMREVWRVLRPDGVVWLNYGDSYNAGTSALRKSSANNDVGGWMNGGLMGDERVNCPGLKPKDLLLMPARVALALQADGWWLRQDVIWAKPNPMPESVTDRPASSHEHVFLLTKRARYFYDADAVREEGGAPTKMPDGWDTGPGAHGTSHREGREKGRKTDKQRGHGRRHAGFSDRWDEMTKAEQQSAGRNLRSVWWIATQPYPGAHFATFPERLVEPCIRAGTSEKGACPACGAPWRREMKTIDPNERLGQGWHDHESDAVRGFRWDTTRSKAQQPRAEGRPTTGWAPTCGCPAAEPVPCVVLDPFAGSGTTGKVAHALWRDFVGIDLAGGDKDLGGHTAHDRMEAGRTGRTMAEEAGARINGQGDLLDLVEESG